MEPVTVSVGTLEGLVYHEGQVLRLQLSDDVGYADFKQTVAMHLDVPEITFDVVFDPPAMEGSQKYSEGLWPSRTRCFKGSEVRHYNVTVIYRLAEFVDALRLLRAVYHALPTGRHCDVRLQDLMRAVPVLERFLCDPIMLGHLAHHAGGSSAIQFEALLRECTDDTVRQSESLCQILGTHAHTLLRYMDANLFLDPDSMGRRLLAQKGFLWLHLPPRCYNDQTLVMWLIEQVSQSHTADFFRAVSLDLRDNFAVMKAFLMKEPCLLEEMRLEHLTDKQQCDLLDCAAGSVGATCISRHLSFDRMKTPLRRAMALAWIRIINRLPMSRQCLLGRHQIALCFLEPTLQNKQPGTFWHEALECVELIPPPESGMISHAILLQPRVLSIFRHKLTDSQDRARLEMLRRASVRSLRTLLAKCLLANEFEKTEERQLLHILEWSNPWGEAEDGESVSN
jgi:hypothetical protein